MSGSLVHEGLYCLIDCKFIEIISKIDAFDLNLFIKIGSLPPEVVQKDISLAPHVRVYWTEKPQT